MWRITLVLFLAALFAGLFRWVGDTVNASGGPAPWIPALATLLLPPRLPESSRMELT
jgi:hypothetical protein